MCVIITTPDESARPTLRQLELCNRANPHGTGLAWRDGRMVEYAKGLAPREIHKLLSRLRGPAIVHFRIASVGGVHPELCHPFPVTHKAELRHQGRARAVLFHNGTWSEHHRYADHFEIKFGRRERVSDSRVAAAIVARFGFAWLKRVDYCRWTMLDAKGIHRIGRWSQIGGCHYSNLHWLPYEAGDFWNLLEA